MKKNIAILLLFACTIISCRHRTMETVYFPQLNNASIAEVGENMFSKVYAYFPVKNYAVLLSDDDARKYKTRGAAGNHFGELDGVKCVLYNRSLSLLDYNCDGYFTHLRNGDKLEKPVRYKLIPSRPVILSSDNFKREVIYQGKIGNKINLLFREFIALDRKFIIRDAYTQDVEYELDLDGRALIGFKGLRINVIKATNQDITYLVVKDFN